MAPEFYLTLSHSRGWLSTLHDYFVHRKDFVYACQQWTRATFSHTHKKHTYIVWFIFSNLSLRLKICFENNSKNNNIVFACWNVAGVEFASTVTTEQRERAALLKRRRVEPASSTTTTTTTTMTTTATTSTASTSALPTTTSFRATTLNPMLCDIALSNLLRPIDDVSQLKGREANAAALRQYCREHARRRESAFIYISGPPGCGKSASTQCLMRDDAFWRSECNDDADDNADDVVDDDTAAQRARHIKLRWINCSDVASGARSNRLNAFYRLVLGDDEAQQNGTHVANLFQRLTREQYL